MAQGQRARGSPPPSRRAVVLPREEQPRVAQLRHQVAVRATTAVVGDDHHRQVRRPASPPARSGSTSRSPRSRGRSARPCGPTASHGLAAGDQEGADQPVDRRARARRPGRVSSSCRVRRTRPVGGEERLAEAAQRRREAPDRRLQLAVRAPLDDARHTQLGARVHRRDELAERCPSGSRRRGSAAARSGPRACARATLFEAAKPRFVAAQDPHLRRTRARSRRACRRSEPASTTNHSTEAEPAAARAERRVRSAISRPLWVTMMTERSGRGAHPLSRRGGRAPRRPGGRRRRGSGGSWFRAGDRAGPAPARARASPGRCRRARPPPLPRSA